MNGCGERQERPTKKSNHSRDVGTERLRDIEGGGDENGGGGEGRGGLEKRRGVGNVDLGRREGAGEGLAKCVSSREGRPYPCSADGDTYTHRLRRWEKGLPERRSVTRREVGLGSRWVLYNSQ